MSRDESRPRPVPAAQHNRVIRAAEKRADDLTGRLERVLQPILDAAGTDAARAFERKAINHLTASAFSQSFAAEKNVKATSTMVALFPRREEAEALVEDGGHGAENLHVTLAFLGDTEGPLTAVRDALLSVAGVHAPLEGQVGGVGLFADNGEGHPSIALPSVPGLVELRVDLTEALSDAEIEYGRSYGYQPHMTVAYRETASPPLLEHLGKELHFDSLWIVRGDVERIELPLTGGRPLTASATDVEREIARVAEEHAPEGGYGKTYWRESDRTVFWDAADWTSNDEADAAVEAFLSIDGVDDVEWDCEVGDPGSGYVQVWPQRATTAAADPPPWTSPAANELIDVDTLVASLRTKTDPVRTAVVETVMKTVVEGVGEEWDVTSPFIGKALETTGSQITNIAETTQVNVMRIIRTAYEQGLSIPDTATAIRAGMKEASAARATLIARTEMVGATNVASLEATKLVAGITGVGYQKSWMTAPGAPNPRHELYEGLDGQTVGLEEEFDVGGSALQYPGDPNGPPEEVCNCRCTMSYVDAGGDETGDVVEAEEG